MHVVGELQIRHNKDRAFIERAFSIAYRVADLIQLTALLVFAAQLTNAFPSTFLDVEFWDPNNYALSLLLSYKTANCTAVLDGSSATGFDGLSVTVGAANSPSIFSEHTERVRVAFAMCAVGFVVTAFNRMLMRHNVFFVTVFNTKMRIHKDVVTALDIALEIGGLVLTSACQPTADMLQAYLKACSVRSEDSVPFVPLAGLYTSASVAIGMHGIATIAVLVVALTMNKRAESKTDEEVRAEKEAQEAAAAAAASKQAQQPYPENARQPPQQQQFQPHFAPATVSAPGAASSALVAAR